MSRHRSSFQRHALAVFAIALATHEATAQPRLPADAEVVVLDPVLRFERVVDESAIAVPPDEQQRFKAMLGALARQELTRRRVAVASADSLDAEVDTLVALHGLSARLGRGQVTAEARILLAQMAERRPNVVILAQYLRVKEGPGGSWDPMSGAIKSTASSGELRAALIAGATGETLWSDAVLHRGRPRPGDETFQKAAQRVFASLAGGALRKGGLQ